MRSYIKKISKILVIILILFVAFLGILNFASTQSSYQTEFTKGTITGSAPSGFYPGKAHVLGDADVPWLGKSFDSKNQNGHNLFSPTGGTILSYATPFYSKSTVDTAGNTHAYYFKTYEGYGIKDPNTKVIKLDYSSPENPWIIRIILDEIVAVGKNEYLGKIHLKIFGDHYITLGYFGLKK
jgi:hypothetical protein